MLLAEPLVDVICSHKGPLAVTRQLCHRAKNSTVLIESLRMMEYSVSTLIVKEVITSYNH